MMTHLVPLAAAVVERRGGMLIHGAIIAREMGIPCVNGVAQAAELLATETLSPWTAIWGLSRWDLRSLTWNWADRSGDYGSLGPNGQHGHLNGGDPAAATGPLRS